MARMRKFCAYKSLERPYTRISKKNKKSYIKSRPVCRVIRFDMGDESKKFKRRLLLISKGDLQMRDNAIESARQSCNRNLEKNLGKGNYKLKIMIYPHHVLRENPLASGAGADRMSTGMQLSFGKPIGIAAQVRKGAILFRLDLDVKNLVAGRRALKLANYKLPCSCSIIEEKIN